MKLRLALLEAHRDTRFECCITDLSHVENKSKILWRVTVDLGLLCKLDDELEPRFYIYVYCKSTASLKRRAHSNSSFEIPVPEQELKWCRQCPTSVCICS